MTFGNLACISNAPGRTRVFRILHALPRRPLLRGVVAIPWTLLAAIAVTTSPSKVDALRPLADEVVVAPRPEDIAPGIMKVTAGQGFDIAFDPVGHANVAPLFEGAAVEAHILHYGMMACADSQMNLVTLMREDLDVHGYTIYRNLRHPERLKALGCTDPRVDSRNQRVYNVDTLKRSVA